jgi:hypothetical protein
MLRLKRLHLAVPSCRALHLCALMLCHCGACSHCHSRSPLLNSRCCWAGCWLLTRRAGRQPSCCWGEHIVITTGVPQACVLSIDASSAQLSCPTPRRCPLLARVSPKASLPPLTGAYVARAAAVTSVSLVAVGVPGSGVRDPGYLRLPVDDRLWDAQGLGATLPPSTLTIHALTGAGGLGKSAAARELLLRARDEGVYPSGFLWINADSSTAAEASFRDAALANPALRDALPPGVLDGSDPTAVVKGVLTWLGEQGRPRWLAVFDNADSSAALASIHASFLPHSGSNGHVIITSRHASLPDALLSRGVVIDVVSELSPADAVMLLLSSLMRAVSYRGLLCRLCCVLHCCIACL